MAVLHAAFLSFLFLAGFAVIAIIVACGLCLLKVRRKWLWLTGAFVVYCACLGIQGYLLTRPAVVFERQFGFAPPGDVSDLKSSSWILGDQGKIRVSFKGSRETLKRILKRGLQREEDLGDLERYQRTFSDTFSRETEEILYSPGTEHVEYVWSGFD